MQRQPALDEHGLDIREAGLQQGVALLGYGHVQLVVGQAALAEEVVADEIGAAGRQQGPHLRVQVVA